MSDNTTPGVPPASSPQGTPPPVESAPAAATPPPVPPAPPTAPPVPPAAAPQQQQAAAYATGPSLPKGLSITSMVAGIGGLVLSFVGIGFLAAVAAVIFGHIAQKREPYARPFWLTGLITGYVGIGLAVLFVLLLLPFLLLIFAGIGSAGWDSYNY